jgi:hypothetical protein
MNNVLTRTFEGWHKVRDAIEPIEDWVEANLGRYISYNSEPYYRHSFTNDHEDERKWQEVESRLNADYPIPAENGVDMVYEATGPGWHWWVFEEFKLASHVGSITYTDKHCRWCLIIDDEYKALECKLAIS